MPQSRHHSDTEVITDAFRLIHYHAEQLSSGGEKLVLDA